MSIVQGLSKYYEAFGLRGVFAISAHRLTGWPKEICIQPDGIAHPLRIRVRTTDVLVYKEIFGQHQYEFDLPFLPRTIVDVGANTGLTSIYYVHRYPNSRVVAIEPEPSNFAMLVKNAAPYPNIFPIQAALWSRDDHISVSEPNPATGAYGKWGFVTHEGSGTRVRSITLPSVMACMKIDSIDLLKVDIEGAEMEVFKHCDWMHNVRCLAIELHDRFKPGCSSIVDSATIGFAKCSHGETTFYLHPKTPKTPVGSGI